MIKKIVFDNGGVIAKVSSKYFLPKYAKMLNVSLKKLTHVYWHLAMKLDVGKESEKEFYNKLIRHVDGKYDYKQLLKVRYSLVKLLPGTLTIVKNLSKKCNRLLKYLINTWLVDHLLFLQFSKEE